ncbi:unnamed protein product [Lota lota]
MITRYVPLLKSSVLLSGVRLSKLRARWSGSSGASLVWRGWGVWRGAGTLGGLVNHGQAHQRDGEVSHVGPHTSVTVRQGPREASVGPLWGPPWPVVQG